MLGTLKRLGMPDEMTHVVRDLYTGAPTRGSCSTGYTDPISIKSGVKQGCLLSPTIFNLSLEPLLRAIEAKRASHTHQLGDQLVTSLA